MVVGKVIGITIGAFLGLVGLGSMICGCGACYQEQERQKEARGEGRGPTFTYVNHPSESRPEWWTVNHLHRVKDPRKVEAAARKKELRKQKKKASRLRNLGLRQAKYD